MATDDEKFDPEIENPFQYASRMNQVEKERMRQRASRPMDQAMNKALHDALDVIVKTLKEAESVEEQITHLRTFADILQTQANHLAFWDQGSSPVSIEMH